MPVSVVRKYADQLVELMRDDDPLALATFHDLTEQLWAQGR
jgi:hypothetical protein